MKKIILRALILTICIYNLQSAICNLQSFAQGTWTKKASVPYYPGFLSAVAFTIGQKGYLGTGSTNIGYTDVFFEYDQAANSWTQKANYPAGTRRFACGFSIGNKGYLGTGQDDVTYAFHNEFWEYDPGTNTWTQKANVGGPARDEASAFSIGGFGYIGTGRYYNPNLTAMKDLWKYDPASNAWTAINNFMFLRDNIDRANFVIGNKAYWGTGLSGLSPTNDFWEYDPPSDTWTQKANFTGAVRYGATGFSICNLGFLGLGIDATGNTLYNDYWMYNPTTNAWSAVTSFPGTPRGDAPSFVINNKAYVGTGFDNVTIANQFNSDMYEFSYGNSLSITGNTICQGQTATLTASGGSSYSWNTGATTASIIVIPTSAASYTYTVTDPTYFCGSPASFTITVSPPPTAVVSNATICSGQTATLTASGGNNYSWSNNATTSSINISPTTMTNYTVTVSNSSCASTAVAAVTISPPPVAAATSATICSGQSASLGASGGGNYLWNNGNTNSTITISPTTNTNYSVVVSFGSCADTAFSSVAVNPSPSVNLGNATLCAGQNLTLDAGNPGASYMWSTGETSQSINVSGAGSYWVIVGLNNCLAKDTVNTFIAPAVHLFDSSLCTISPIILDPGDGATSYLWSNGSTSQTISVDVSGNYWVQVMYGNCKTSDTAKITGDGIGGTLYVPNAFTPNDDNLNEIFLAKGTDITSFDMKIFDRWGNLLFVSDDLNKGWDGKIQGGNYTLKNDGLEVSQEDVYICKINYTTQCFPKIPKKIIGHLSIVK